jgi:trans-aconitate 2-methyltransferase
VSGSRAARAAPSHDWDAETYHRVATPQVEWGREVIQRMRLRGHESVLDAGCGSGRVTELLLERLPRGRVIAVDSSSDMVARARETLGHRAEVFAADLTELYLEEPVDAVFSSAVFHWIADHDRLFQRLHDALKPGGRLVAQCGGEGNVTRFLAVIQPVCEEPPFAEFLAGWRGNWNFPSPERTARALERAGYRDVDCHLDPREEVLPEPREYLRAVCLSPHLGRLPASLHDRFVDSVLERMTSAAGAESPGAAGRSPVAVDYVRLNIDARRP